MGSIFRVPILRLPSVGPLLSLFNLHNIFTIGATPEAQILLPSATLPNQALALFVGNEGKGLSSSVRKVLDLLVAIPMSNSIDSLSINAATAVILYAMTHSSNPLKS
jgi:23S rRNA (guanosine2251-2'-O)-methyltransferase